MVAMDTKQNMDTEIDWLANKLRGLERDQHMMIVSEVDGHAVGNSEIIPRIGRIKHYGLLGIA